MEQLIRFVELILILACGGPSECDVYLCGTLILIANIK